MGLAFGTFCIGRNNVARASARLCWIFWTRVHAARTHLPLLQVDRPRPDRFDKRSSHHAAELPTPAHVLADLALEQRDALRAENLALQFLQQLALGELAPDPDAVRTRRMTAVDVARATVLSGIHATGRAAALPTD